MSDISLDLSGVIALLVFMISAAGFGLAGLISLIIAIAGSGLEKGIQRSKAFGFFLAALPLTFVNLAGFAMMFYTADSNSHNTNSILDTVACGWALLQPFIWIAVAVIYIKVRLK